MSGGCLVNRNKTPATHPRPEAESPSWTKLAPSWSKLASSWFQIGSNFTVQIHILECQWCTIWGRGGPGTPGNPLGTPWERLGDPKFIEKRIDKTVKKRYLPKTTFFRNLSAFRAFRHRCSSILGAKMNARTIIL